MCVIFFYCALSHLDDAKLLYVPGSLSCNITSIKMTSVVIIFKFEIQKECQGSLPPRLKSIMCIIGCTGQLYHVRRNYGLVIVFIWD